MPQSIRWSFTDEPGAEAKIELLKAGTVVATPSLGTDLHDGEFTWAPPATLATASTYTIRVTSKANNTVKDVSAQFTIRQPTITVTSPNGGQLWAAGSTHLITWSFRGNPGPNVKIVLLKAGTAVATLSASTPIGSNGIGSFSWQIPAGQAKAATYKIKVVSTTVTTIVDTSDATFSIT